MTLYGGCAMITDGENRDFGPDRTLSRRSALQAALAAGVGGGILAACGKTAETPANAPQSPSAAPAGLRPLRVAFGNAGLASTWCALGKTTAELWGKLLNVEVTWFDGEFNTEKQRS